MFSRQEQLGAEAELFSYICVRLLQTALRIGLKLMEMGEERHQQRTFDDPAISTGAFAVRVLCRDGADAGRCRA